jgi:uncharacterized protein YjbJ (UPF0337 family)
LFEAPRAHIARELVLHSGAHPADARNTTAYLNSIYSKSKFNSAVIDTSRSGSFHLTIKGEISMNWERIEGNWKQLTGKAKENWGKLTDDDFDVVAGRRDQLAGKIQERYGIAKEEAEEQVTSWERSATDDWFV